MDAIALLSVCHVNCVKWLDWLNWFLPSADHTLCYVGFVSPRNKCRNNLRILSNETESCAADSCQICFQNLDLFFWNLKCSFFCIIFHKDRCFVSSLFTLVFILLKEQWLMLSPAVWMPLKPVWTESLVVSGKESGYNCSSSTCCRWACLNR